ncbi:d-lactate dehydrogenase (cytochrome) [Fusarium mexicanum]|uniref:D-lactate dehydrogenase (Cytochrome) n=1 Tax=Fusarium mexicanum TaxID=751941 RepID=A0A8H5MM69_9HYPO|nr:d-lactate dehydrogenase (cytochrome) [Fusarium mexicanum]
MLKAVDEIRRLLGEDIVSVDLDDLDEHGYSEWSTSNTDVRPVAIVRPQTTEEVSSIARICTKYKVPMTPYGAGSSVEGNFSSPHSGVCLDLSGMDKIVAFHPEDMDIVVQAGVNWINMNEEIKHTGLFLPLDPSPTALIGGMIATNCSGTNAMRYGTMKDYVINLTVVLSDGSVIKTRHRPRKTSAGYNLTALFTGSEGTLGIITEATLKLAIIPENFSVATATFSTVKEAADAAFKMMRRGIPLAALEMMDDVQMKVINQSGGAGGRLWDEHPTLFLKFSGSQNAVQESIKQAKEITKSNSCRSFEFAKTEDEMQSLWSARKQALWASLAVRPEGTQLWSTDVAVPLSRMAELIEISKQKASQLGLFNSVMGHVGDGNFHQLVMYNPDNKPERQAVSDCVDGMMVRALEMEGTVSGEHGIGLGKKLGPATIGVMKAIKDTLDPHWLLNPARKAAVTGSDSPKMTDRTGNDGLQGVQIDFVPINQASSPPESKRRPSDRKRPCQRCSADNQPCEFRASRSTKRTLSRAAEDTESVSNHSHTGTDISIPALIPLAPRDVPVLPLHETEYVNDLPVTDCSQGPTSPSALDARERIISTHINNASDALDLLTFAASGTRAYNNPSATPSRESQVPSTTSPTGLSDVALSQDRAWKTFSLIRKGIVSQQEVMDYLGFFFDQLWPLKPVVPSYYRDRATYGQLVAEEPLLVVCLVTLSSRYFPLPGGHGEIRSERIHWQAWRILQRSLQSVMWGSTTTRSLGAIASMLLLIDWHVKAINNPSNFTEGEDEVHDVADSHGFKPSSNNIDSLTGQRRYGMVSLMERLNIISPAYRSNKMSWTLLSNAIALAHEGCCFQNESSSSRFTPSSMDSVRKEWNGLLCVFIYFADEVLATRLGLEPLLPEKSRQIVKDRFATTFTESLPDSHLWEGYFELSIETRKGREFLLSLKSRDGSFSDLDLVPHLERLRRALQRWKRQYYHQDDINSLLNACLVIEFYYISLFCFAPAAQAIQTGSTSLPQETLQTLSEFEDHATQASHALLSIVVDSLKPLGLIKYLPVRCWLFIVAASLHLLKDLSRAHPNIHLLHRVINVVHNGSPDDSHMAVQFAKFLGIMVQIAVPAASSIASRATSGEDGNGTEHQIMDGIENDVCPYTFNDVAVEGISDWNALLDLDLAPDLFMWWESMHT